MKIKLFFYIFTFLMIITSYLYPENPDSKNKPYILKDCNTKVTFTINEPWKISPPAKSDPEYLDILILREGIRYEEKNSSGMISIVINNPGKFDLNEYMSQDLDTITKGYTGFGGKGELLKNFYPDISLKPHQQGGAIYIVYDFPKENEKLHQYLIYIKNKKDIVIINVFGKDEKTLNEESVVTFIKSLKIE